MDINIRFSADDRLLNSLDYLSGWMCALYKLLKEQQPNQLLPSAGLPTLEPEERAKPAEEAPAESAKKAEKERRAEVKRIAGNAARNGKSDEVKELIARYGVHKLSGIPIDKLDAFAEEVSKL